MSAEFHAELSHEFRASVPNCSAVKGQLRLRRSGVLWIVGSPYLNPFPYVRQLGNGWRQGPPGNEVVRRVQGLSPAAATFRLGLLDALDGPETQIKVTVQILSHVTKSLALLIAPACSLSWSPIVPQVSPASEQYVSFHVKASWYGPVLEVSVSI